MYLQSSRLAAVLWVEGGQISYFLDFIFLKYSFLPNIMFKTINAQIPLKLVNFKESILKSRKKVQTFSAKNKDI